MSNIHKRIQSLIEETNDAYGSAGTVNADYAEFASLAYSDFQHILKNPLLTRQKLAGVLRAGLLQYGTSARKTPGWSVLLAHHVENNANEDIQASTQH